MSLARPSTRNLKGLSYSALLALIVLAALALRLYGLNWDSGHMFHPDERMILMTVQGSIKFSPLELDRLLDPKTSPLNPHFFAYGSFPLYLLRLISQLLGLVQQSLAGQDLRLVGRALSALFDTGTVMLIYLLGARVYSKRAGLLASAFIAFAVLHIQLSHFYTVDVILSFLIVLTVYFCTGIVERGDRKSALLVGAALGLALATKVSVLPLLLAVGVAFLLYCIDPGENRIVRFSLSGARLQQSIINFFLMLLVAGLVFVIAEPYAIIDRTTFISSVTEQSEMVRRIRDYPYTRQYIGVPLYEYEVQQLGTWGLGPALGLSFWLGLLFTVVAAARSRRKSDILLLSWVVPYFAISGSFQVKFLRYLLPMTPFMALMAGRMFVDIRDWVEARWDDVKAARFDLPSALPSVPGLGFETTLVTVAQPANGPVHSSAVTRWARSGESVARRLDFLRRLPGRPSQWVDGLLAIVLALTIFYALAYDNIYSSAHPAVQAAAWINANVPRDATIVKEHWEEALPDLVAKRAGSELGPYDPDESPDKWRNMLTLLDQADYVVFYSNRLYGTIPRLPDRYPITTRYYKQLFSGELGFDLVYSASSYPNLLGVSFKDDTFSRPHLMPPAPLVGAKPSPITISGGYADESFTVYDHPLVMVFAKHRPMSQEQMRAALGMTGPALTPPVTAPAQRGLMLSSGDVEADRSGGTWSELFDRTSIVNRLPTLTWLIIAELMFIIVLPLGLMLFKALPDRGYLLVKSLSILLLAYIPWLLASYHVLTFSRGTILVGALVLLLASALVYWRRRDEIVGFLITNRRLIVIFELVYLCAFLLFYVLRLANPDLWHAWRGGEKPMDFAYLNAVTKTTYFPPYDPWFAGGYLNYYYFGQVIVATLIKLSGVVPATAYNLAVPLLFACTVAGACSVAFNLAAWSLPFIGRGRPPVSDPAASNEDVVSRPINWGPVYCGIAAGLFVAVLGNLDGLAQLLDGLAKASGSTFSSSVPGLAGLWNVAAGLSQIVIGGKALPAFDFWRSSRMMPPTPNITEFPYFTFLFADLHAHLIALPFTLLSLGLSLALVYRGWRDGRAHMAVAHAAEIATQPVVRTHSARPVAPVRAAAPSSLLELALAAPPRIEEESIPDVSLESPGGTIPEPRSASSVSLGNTLRDLVRNADPWSLLAVSFVLGALRVINSWDFPTYLGLTCCSLLAGGYFARRRFDAVLIADVVFKSLVVYFLSTLFYLPFHQNYQLFYSGVQPSQERTPIQQYLGVNGFFLACIGSLILLELATLGRRSYVRRLALLVTRHWERLPRLVRIYRQMVRTRSEQDSFAWTAVAVGLAILVVLLVVGLYLFAFLGVSLVVVCALGIHVLRKDKAGAAALVFVLLTTGAALALGLGVDLITIQGDVGRMNTVFKFYLQAWVLFAVGSAFALWWVLQRVREIGPARLGSLPRLWTAGIGFLLISAAIYPLAATPVRLADRFGPTPPTLDGTAYMRSAVYQEEKGRIDLGADEQGIRWLQDNVKGSPVILEANTPLYRWGSRISVYTGLPTVIGWDWHQKQQRWTYQSSIDSRLADVRTIFSTSNPDQALELLKKYDVRYIYVGQLERLYYPAPGLAKFDAMVGTQLTLDYETAQVKIYRVGAGG